MKRLLTTQIKAKTIINLLVLCAVAVFALPIDTHAASTLAELQAILDANYPDGLPRYMTPEEQQWLDAHPEEAPPPKIIGMEEATVPTGTIWTPGEYEELDGVIVAWEAYPTPMTSFVKEVSESDTNAKVYVVVDTTSERTSVTTTLTNAGANMSNVAFIVRATDSVWIRDYGPRYFLLDGDPAIMDHKYNRSGRPNDDALPPYCASSSVPFSQSEPVYWLGGTSDADSLTHGGGNFHCFSNGDAFMSTLIVEENPTLTQAQIETIVEDHFNVNLTIFPRLSASVDATGHIDMWFLPLSDTKVLISQFSTNTYGQQTTTNNAAATMASMGYTVYRTPAWNSGSTHYTYTNAAIVNNKVFIPWYNNATNDAAALATFTSAMPGYEIIQIDCREIIPAAGAIHCIIKHVYAPAATEPPGQATNPNPTNGATGVNINADLSWTADPNATSHDVYFGTDSTPDSGEFIGNQPGTTYDPGTLSNSTTYYWRIDEKNDAGTTPGVVWSFTTAPPDTTAPTPNPMTWASVPAATGPTTITMTATTATDATTPPVQYYFECTTDGSKSSTWQTSTTYVASGLAPSTQYSFRVKARDSAPALNETGWSSTESATTPVQPPITVYDYNGITNPSGSHKAQDGEIDVTDAVIIAGTFGARRDTIAGWNYWAEATTAEYAALVSSDDSRYSTADPGYGDNAAMLFEFYVDENPADVEQIDVSVEIGRGASTDTGYAYIWNYNTSSYTVMGTQSGTADAVISYSITSNPENYIDPSTGQVTVFVVNMDDSDVIQVDHISVTIHSSQSNVTVPNVVGMAQADANSTIIAANLIVGTITTECSNTVDAGDVISQDPTSGSSVPPGSAVDLVISSGPAVVPDVLGMTEAQAEAALIAASLIKGDVTSECSDTVDAGDVISSSPAALTVVACGSAVDLVISTGPAVVPDVLGMTEAQAEAALIAASLIKGDVTSECSDTVDAGDVISSSPAALTVVACGSAVDLVISSGHCARIISGYITEPDSVTPVEGVLVDAGGGISDMTDANGYYQLTVNYGWSGTATPSRAGYIFDPVSMTYNNVTTNLTNKNYMAIMNVLVISGYVIDATTHAPMAGVLMSPDNDGGPFTSKYYGGGSDMTNASGYYRVIVDYNWSGSIVPSKYAYGFEPNSIEYINVTEDKVETQKYVGTLLTYTITGYIKNSCEVPIEGVLVQANNGGNSDTTDANGYYEVWVNYNWSGTVTPSKELYTFDPDNNTYTSVLNDLIEQNYTATNIYDLDCDSFIGYGDIEIICENWLSNDVDINDGDFNDDDIINFLDFADFAAIW